MISSSISFRARTPRRRATTSGSTWTISRRCTPGPRGWASQVGEGYFSRVYELPDGSLRYICSAPSGNLIEVNHPDASGIDHAAVDEVERVPVETEAGAKAKLYER